MRRIASDRIGSHHEEGERASGGGSATSVAERCSKTGPLRMRASSSRAPLPSRRADRESGGGGGGGARLLIPSRPTRR